MYIQEIIKRRIAECNSHKAIQELKELLREIEELEAKTTFGDNFEREW